MASMGGRRLMATLAAVAVLGLFAVAPLQAQNSRVGLRGIKTAMLPTGADMAYGRLPGCEVYLVGDGQARPACVLLRPTGADKGGQGSRAGQQKPDKGALEELGERFLRAFKLRNYGITVLKDASAVLLNRDNVAVNWSYRGQQGLRALADTSSLAPTISWLNERCGGSPHRLEGSRLTWRKTITVGSSNRELEVWLDLLRGVPCYVDIRLRQVSHGKVDEVLSEQLQLQLAPVAGDKGAELRRKLGSRPMAYMEDPLMRRSRRPKPGLCLMRGSGENGLYRLAETNTLQALHERGGREEGSSLPVVNESPWPSEEQPARPATPAAQPAEPAPGVSEHARTEPSTPPAAPAAETPPAAAPAMPTPAEAREKYAERLKAL